MSAEAIDDEPDASDPDDCVDQIEQWASILATLISHAAAAAELEKIAAELRALQPPTN